MYVQNIFPLQFCQQLLETKNIIIQLFRLEKMAAQREEMERLKKLEEEKKKKDREMVNSIICIFNRM